MSLRIASRPLLSLAAAFLLGSGSAAAHDFWIEPGDFRPQAGATIPIGLRVGMEFTGEPVARKPERIEWFASFGPQGRQPIEGAAGAEPAGTLRIAAAGIHLVAYRSLPAFIELGAKEFEGYLAEEGLQEIIALRARRGEKGKPGRETYSRCAKALLAAGGARAGGHDRVLGMPLELVPDTSPYDPDGMKTARMRLRLLLRGQPLRGALVAAVRKTEPKRVLTGWTDAAGRVTLALDKPGAWLVKSVHMFEPEAGGKADWESLWTTLTFEIPDGAGD